nr:MAG TPA: hypothetical protein [Caudoviricetes sp.]
MQKGDTIRARFLTMPAPGRQRTICTLCARRRWCMCIQRGAISWRSARACGRRFSRRRC